MRNYLKQRKGFIKEKLPNRAITLYNKSQKIKNKSNVKKVHNFVGKDIRKTIKKLGEIMPKDLPTPSKSLKELKKDYKLKINKFSISNVNINRCVSRF